jgi:hypothetical protein
MSMLDNISLLTELGLKDGARTINISLLTELKHLLTLTDVIH